ncbi:RNA-dependent RNA polymerase 6-like isoform X1 [Cornus florida]|uniref:RNA-dependent RNA polymerase 6-like isoform X1 n=2 Tax=Cornus florida TaxID=4283 RepID=UPI0028A02DE0|nr:RNA-dependent RNA polymerase 6-like isoform X1 [Cornus florida]
MGKIASAESNMCIRWNWKLYRLSDWDIGNFVRRKMVWEGGENDMVVTQVSVGGFDEFVTAKMILDYFEDKIGLVWRCRLKTSSTPPDSYPNFEINVANVQRTNEYEKVEPHAFVHFATPDYAKSALDAAGRCELILFKNPLKVSLGPQNPRRMSKWRIDNVPFRFSDVKVEIGLLVSRDEFFVGWRGPANGVDFLVDPFDGTCKFLFTKDTAFSLKGTNKHVVMKCDFKVEFLVRDVNEIKQIDDMSSKIILLQLASSPLLYYRTADDDIENSVPFDLLDDDDPWIRTTDFTPSGVIGRCNTYRMSISPRHHLKLKKALKYLEERRVQTEMSRQQLKIRDEPDFGMPKADPFFCIQYKDGVSFKIMFLVNAVVHKGIINQHQLSDRFFNLLRNQPEEVNVAALKHICACKHPLFDAYMRLKLVQEWLLKNPKLLQRPKELAGIVEVRRLVITPTKAYCLPPEVELSNRVIRNYREVSDRFLRVTFMDEGMQTLNKNVLSYYTAPIVWEITANSSPQKTTMFKRVKSIVSEGFRLCRRRYSFLAFSANQLRDRSAWFFAEDQRISVDDIINWMGKFTNRNVAKCAARMGQCFSSTYATVEVPLSDVDSELPDIKRNGHVFSDGIGMITSDLAMEVAERLQLTVNPPCAYQIRYAGYKGVVACWPSKNDGFRLALGPSMDKFESNHKILEICSWTRFQPGFLNREIVTLLSTLNVQDEIFWRMQECMISKLNQMLVDTDVAFEVLTASCAEQGNTAAIMLSAGFKPPNEPHLRGMLTSIRAAQLGDLREKCRIFVPSGRWLMGCLDELGILQQGQCFIQVSNPSLQNCFAKHGSRFSETDKNLQVIKGTVIIAKNPCLHPGDLRILEAVNVPELNHLFDCLVFPQKGDRPHANEASGSDLDGDLYFVTWDENLIPPSKKSWTPMEYAPAEVKELPRPVKHMDITDFFSRNIVNENLGAICHAHVVHADLSEYGALDEKCIKLAELAATAVDFPKTGKLVTMPFELKPKLYPDFMGKEEFQSYKSKKILGKLYRQIKDACDKDEVASSELTLFPEDIPYDTDLEVPGSTDFIDDAWTHKCSYDGQLNGLLGQYKVNREEEVVTGHIWSMPKYSSKKQGELKERLKHAYSALQKEFRNIFEQMDPDIDQPSDKEKNAIYERKASAWYQVTYHPSWLKKSLELQELDGAGETVRLSFAWITADYLARIKIRRREIGSIDCIKPIDSLVRYLADRI